MAHSQYRERNDFLMQWSIFVFGKYFNGGNSIVGRDVKAFRRLICDESESEPGPSFKAYSIRPLQRRVNGAADAK
jgi:hypothetical protein